MKLVFAAGKSPQPLPTQGVKRIGSAPDADIVLQATGMLPQHCELQIGPQGVMMRVARGASVTVNGRAVEGLIALRPGDRIGFAQVEATLVSSDAAQAFDRGAIPSPANDDLGATMVRSALSKYALRAQTGRMLGRSFGLAGATVVGRAPECQLRLEEASLSRKHARLIPTEDGVIVEDLGSTNGTFLNNERVQRAVAKPGDEIGFDTLRFRLFEAGKDDTKRNQTADAATVGTARWVWWLLGAAALAAVVVYLWR
jgi:pSer/pThr/pTyr-binding forkhead associated (FHA) protein